MDYNYNKEENCYVLLGTYDNFGERCDIEYIFRYEGDVLKIDEIKYQYTIFFQLYHKKFTFFGYNKVSNSSDKNVKRVV